MALSIGYEGYSQGLQPGAAFDHYDSSSSGDDSSWSEWEDAEPPSPPVVKVNNRSTAARLSARCDAMRLGMDKTLRIATAPPNYYDYYDHSYGYLYEWS